jgi:hypothetical protein
VTGWAGAVRVAIDLGRAYSSRTAVTTMKRTRLQPLPVLPALRRPARGFAAIIAMMMVAANVCAAMGLCIAKAGATGDVAPVAAVASVTPAAADAPCPHHDGASAPVAQRSQAPDPALSAHCPQDDPGAQGRTADLPSPDLMLAGAAALAMAPAHAASSAAPAAFFELPPTPPYARHARLLL